MHLNHFYGMYIHILLGTFALQHHMAPSVRTSSSKKPTLTFHLFTCITIPLPQKGVHSDIKMKCGWKVLSDFFRYRNNNVIELYTLIGIQNGSYTVRLLQNRNWVLEKDFSGSPFHIVTECFEAIHHCYFFCLHYVWTLYIDCEYF